MLKTDFIKKVLSEELNVTMNSITLNQQSDLEPLTLIGSGEVSYRDSGPYVSFIINDYSDVEYKRIVKFNDSYKSHQIIDDSLLFTFVGIDASGNKWVASDIYPEIDLVSGNVSFDANELKMATTSVGDDNYAVMVIDEKIDIPCNKRSDLNGKSELNNSEFKVNDTTIRMEIRENVTTIYVKSEFSIDMKLMNSILESLSIASGSYFRAKIAIEKNGCDLLFLLRRNDTRPKVKLYNLLPNRMPWYINDWECFINCYIKYFNSDDVFFRYWLKAFNAHQADIETSMLSLTVAIEGLVQKLFKEFKKVDVEYKELCAAVKVQLSGVDFNDRVRVAINKLFDNAGSPSTKSILYNMSIEGIVSNGLIDNWVSLRNQTAHAKHLKSAEIINNFNSYKKCLSLFYILLVYRIGYEGRYMQYHLDEVMMNIPDDE